MDVRIVPAASAEYCPAADFVRVSTCCDPEDDTVTLATVQRVVEKPADAEKPGPKWLVRTLIKQRPMSLAAALGFAKCYAARKQIPVVSTQPADR